MQPLVIVIIRYSAAVVAVLAMVWAYRQHRRKRVRWSRPLALFCGLLAVGLAVTAIMHQRRYYAWLSSTPLPPVPTGFELRVLGEYLAAKCPGTRCLVVHPAVGEYNRKWYNMLMSELKEGMGGKLAITSTAATGEVEDENGGPPMPMAEMMLTAEKFDQIVDKNPECNLVISLVGLPWDYQNLRLWRRNPEDMPRLALVNPTLTDEALQELIRKETIVVVLLSNPRPPAPPGRARQFLRYLFALPPTPAPRDAMDAFNRYYLLLKADNLDKVMAENPRLFGK